MAFGIHKVLIYCGLPVSYTHLDVYKRQIYIYMTHIVLHSELIRTWKRESGVNFMYNNWRPNRTAGHTLYWIDDVR